MPNEKSSFPMIYFEKNHTLIILGGANEIYALKEVSEYIVKQNVWRGLSSFPFGIL